MLRRRRFILAGIFLIALLAAVIGAARFFLPNPFYKPPHVYEPGAFATAAEAAKFSTYIVGGPSLAECAAQGISCTAYNNLPVSYVPDVTLNVGVYYGIEHNNHVLIEPRFWVESTGTQHLWSNNTAQPTTQTMPEHTTANLSFNAPINFEKQSFDLKLDLLNLGNARYNQWEYISSGAYFAGLYPGSTPPSGYINAYPGAPRSVYGTLTYHF